MFEIFIREMVANWNYFWTKTRHKMVDKFAQSVLQNMDIVGSIDGAFSSLRFEREHLRNVPYFKKRTDLYWHCLRNAANDGVVMEFGVYKGDSINLMAKHSPSRAFFGFDSFEGLPETWTIGAKKGAFDVKGRLPRTRKNVTFVPGFFDKSLPPFLEKFSKDTKIALIHIDCDLYSSTKYVLEQLDIFILPGTVIVFDEYYNRGDWEVGEYRAFKEYIEEKGKNFEYLGYIRIGEQVAVKII